MPEKDPSNWQWGMAAIFSALGCVARWQGNVQMGQRFHFGFFLIDLVISSGIGLLAFAIAHEGGASIYWSAAIAGFMGNVGSQVFDQARILWRRRLGLPPEEKDDDNTRSSK